MDTLLSTSDITASPGLISPIELENNASDISVESAHDYAIPYENLYELDIKNVGDMTVNELAANLDGTVGMGFAKWLIIIIMFTLIIFLVVPILVGTLLQWNKADKLSRGARDYKIFQVTEGDTQTVQPSSSSSYILSINYGDNISNNNNIQSTLFVDGSLMVNTGSIHTFTASSSFGDTSGTFATLLIVNSITSEDSTGVTFKLLDSTSGTDSFIVTSNVTNPTLNSTYATSRSFIWTSNNVLEEIDNANGIII